MFIAPQIVKIVTLGIGEKGREKKRKFEYYLFKYIYIHYIRVCVCIYWVNQDAVKIPVNKFQHRFLFLFCSTTWLAGS